MRIRSKLMIAAALAVLASPAQAEWVASWAASPHAPLGTEGPFAAASYDNVTISQILRISEGGDKVRIRLSNRYGSAPLEIGAARVVQIDDAGQEVAATSRTLTFGGEPGGVIPRGAPFVSDAVEVGLPDLARLKVELYLPSDTGPCTCHLTGLDELAVSPPGNHVGKAFEPISRAQHRAFLAAVEVDSADALGTIVAFGDSITDGVGSTPGTNRRWPDVLANRLQDAGMGWAVANAAVSGNRELRPFRAQVEGDLADALGTIVAFGDSHTDGVGSTPGTNRRWPDVLANRLQDAGMGWAVANAAISGNRVLSPGMGEAALARFDEDVMSLPNVKYLIVFEGVNDTGNRFGPQRGGPQLPGLDQPQITVEQMIAGYKQLIARAHAKGIKVIGSPIGPYTGASYWTEEGEA